MSRYEFEEPGVSIAIGWDAPLATFYLQVWSEALQTVKMDEEARATPQIWLGGDYAEPDRLLAVARAYMPSLPETLGHTLRIDQLAAPAKPRPQRATTRGSPAGSPKPGCRRR